MNWADKSQQEKAEWIAENVLKAERVSQRNLEEYLTLDLIEKIEDYWDFEFVDGCAFHLCNRENLEAFLKTPDGFFAVWDAWENKVYNLEGYSCFTYFKNPKGSFDFSCVAGTNQRVEYTGKDRYEAFYHAVFEAMKDESS